MSAISQHPLTTTMARIQERAPNVCISDTIDKNLGNPKRDEPVPYSRILRTTKLGYTFWSACTEPRYDRQWRRLLVAFTHRIQHLITDEDLLKAIPIAELYAQGAATHQDIEAQRARIKPVSEAKVAYYAEITAKYTLDKDAGDNVRFCAEAAANAAAFAAGPYESARWHVAWAKERAIQAELFLETVKEN